jgi:hypothetical protein
MLAVAAVAGEKPQGAHKPSTKSGRLPVVLRKGHFPSFISFISCLPFWLSVAVTAKAILPGSVNARIPTST